MNTKMLAILALGLGLSAPAFPTDEHHPEKAAGTDSVATAAPAPRPAADAKALEANAARLQAQAKRIARAKPGPERDELVAEHMHSLHESMEMARGMMSGTDMESCPMMKGMGGGMGMGMGMRKGMGGGMGMGIGGCPMMKGMGMGMEGAGKADGCPADRMDRLEKRMDMLEQTMKGGAAKP